MYKRSQGFLVFLSLLVTFSYFFQGGGANQNATISEIREVVEHGSADITAWKALTSDVSFYNGHYYSNKSPSVFFFAAPIYGVVFKLAKIFGVDTESIPYKVFAHHLLTILIASLWGAFLGPLLIRIFRTLYPEMSQRLILALSVAVPVATLVFPYATVGFTHVFETFWALAVFYFWLKLVESPDGRKVGFQLALSLGFLVLASPIHAAWVPILLAVAAWKVVGLSRAVELAIVVAVPLIPLLIYNYLLFDSIFKTNRHFQPWYFTDPNLFLGVYGKPQFSNLANIFGNGNRSVFPGHLVLLLGLLPGNLRKLRTIGLTKLTVPSLVVAIGLVHLLCFNGWHGGSAFGPRYFLPGLVILVILSLGDAARKKVAVGFTLTIGVVVHLLVTLTNLMPGEEVAEPWIKEIFPRLVNQLRPEFYFPAFLAPWPQYFKYNVGHLLGFDGWMTLAPLLLVQGVFLRRIFFNRKPNRDASLRSA